MKGVVHYILKDNQKGFKLPLRDTICFIWKVYCNYLCNTQVFGIKKSPVEENIQKRQRNDETHITREILYIRNLHIFLYISFRFTKPQKNTHFVRKVQQHFIEICIAISSISFFWLSNLSVSSSDPLTNGILGLTRKVKWKSITFYISR